MQEAKHADMESAPISGALARDEVVAERYRVNGLLGAGPRGVVYRAQHIELGTPVALRVIPPGRARDRLVWRRFAREVRALSALHNQHVLRVRDAGTLPSGARYVVTDLLEGTDLRRVLAERGALPVQRAADYVCQVCSALCDVHAIGMVHRDVQPKNIFLARYRAAEPIIKLMEFGLAIFLEDGSLATDSGQLTMPGCGVSSPQYSSPEQLGNPNRVDGRSDLWAVGLVLFEFLTGRSPFAGMNTAEMARAIVEGPLPRVEDAGQRIPPRLSALVQRCLERDPERRPASAEEVLGALEPFSRRDAPGAGVSLQAL